MSPNKNKTLSKAKFHLTKTTTTTKNHHNASVRILVCKQKLDYIEQIQRNR